MAALWRSHCREPDRACLGAGTGWAGGQQAGLRNHPPRASLCPSLACSAPLPSPNHPFPIEASSSPCPPLIGPWTAEDWGLMSWSTARAPWGGSRPGLLKSYRNLTLVLQMRLKKKPNVKKQPASSSALRPQAVPGCTHTRPPGREDTDGDKDPVRPGPALVRPRELHQRWRHCACVCTPGEGRIQQTRGQHHAGGWWGWAGGL